MLALLRSLAALALLLSLVSVASAQQALPELPAEAGNYHVVLGPDGAFVCEHTELEALDNTRRASVNLTPLPSLNPPEQLGGLRIILRATDQLLERPDALLAFRRAAARWERAITTPITVVYDIDYGPTRFGGSTYSPSTIASATGAAGLAATASGLDSPQGVLARMRARAEGDAQLQSLYDAIPSPVPSTVVNGEGVSQPISFIFATQPILQLLGYLPQQLDPDPTVNPLGDVPNLGFNSAFDFDFDPNDGTDSDLIDFEAVVIHEMGHSLGFSSAIGFAAQSFGVIATPWDLFRVRPEAVTPGESLTDGQGWETAQRVVTPGPVESETFTGSDGETYFTAVQVFFDGLGEYQTSTATGGRAGGDGQQASHWRDDSRRPPNPRDSGDRYIGIMDPNFGPGVRQLYKYPDLRVLETLSYGINYNPSYADGFELAVAGESVPVDGLLSAPLQLGDVATGETVTVPVTVTNPGTLAELAFDVEVITDAVYPEGAALTIEFETAEGTAQGGESTTVNLRVGGSDAPAFFAGRLRFRTNFDDLLVIEVPVEFSVGGATEPRLTLTGVPEGNDFGSFGDLSEEDTAQIKFTITNDGSLPLEFDVLTQLQARAFPFSTAPDATGARQRAGSSLSAFLGARAAAADVLYAFDFEDQAAFDALAKGGSVPGDWQLVSGGAAALSGHSATRAAYFGQITPSGTGNVYQYRNLASGRLLLPAINMSSLDADDLAVLSFNYYLQAEEGFDFASVLYSVDGGTTYEVATTSDDGLLVNTDTGWMSVMVDVTAVAGLPDPVIFAFEFKSDPNITDEGWYIDDVQVSVVRDANPFFADPRTGTLVNESAEVTVTADGGALEPGFYTGVVEVITNQRNDDPDAFRLSFSAGDPNVPTLVPSTASLSVTVVQGQTEEVDLNVRNGGAAPLTYIRVLEPALSQYQDTPSAAASAAAQIAALPTADVVSDKSPEAVPAAVSRKLQGVEAVEVVGDVSAELPTTFALGITQLPDGRVLVSAVGTTTAVPQSYIVSEDLSSVVTVPGVTPLGNQILGVAYNDRTGSLWYAGLQDGELFEVKLNGNTLTATGEKLDLGFGAASLAYSPALDAFLAVPFQSDLVFAVDVEGNQLPGYPFQFFRGSVYSGLSISGGVLEIGYLDLFNTPEGASPEISYVQYDQFGQLYAGNSGSPIVRFDDPDITASQSVRAFVRSRTSPNNALYVLTRGSGNAGLNARVVSIDPPDLDPATQTFVEALEPAYGNDLAPGQSASISFALRPPGEAGAVDEDEVAFLTNSPTDRIVRVPVEASIITGTSTDGEFPDAFAFHGAQPNPLRGDGIVTFDLAEAAAVTVSVYNTIGQRVAVLTADAPLGAGTHELPIRTGSLAAGVYIVRVDAGAQTGTQKLTVVR